MSFGTVITTVQHVGSGTATASTTQTQTGGLAATPTSMYTVLTVANASDAVTLPIGSPGVIMVLKGGANAAKLFPPVGGAINGGTVDAAFTLAATVQTLVVYTSPLNANAIQGAA